MEFVSVWEEAGRDAEAEQSLRALTSARVKAAAFWPFLAAAEDQTDFENRLALATPKIVEAATSSHIQVSDLTDSLRADFGTILASRMHTVGSFYVETSDGEKVGGPYDTKDAAQEAISGGDVTGDGLKVAEGDSDDSGDDEDGDPDDDGEDGGDTDDAEDAESDTDDDAKDKNPFAKKESSKTAAGGYPEEERYEDEHKTEAHPSGVNVHTFSSTGQAYNQSQVSNKIKDGDVLSVPSEGVHGFLMQAWPVASHHGPNGPGEFHSTTHGMEALLKDEPQYRTSHEVATSLGQGENHAGRTAAKTAINDAEMAQWSNERHTQTAHDHLHGTDDDEDEFQGHDYADDDQDPHYSRFEHWGSRMFPLVKSALPEGEDPLDKVVEAAPPGPGVAEKEIHHGEYVEHPDNSLVNQFTSVYKKFAG